MGLNLIGIEKDTAAKAGFTADEPTAVQSRATRGQSCRPHVDRISEMVNIDREQHATARGTDPHPCRQHISDFFQAYMVAPLIPRLSHEFLVSEQFIGLVVPAYMIPYGLSTLFYGLLSDRLGRRRIMHLSLAAFIIPDSTHGNCALGLPTHLVAALDWLGRERRRSSGARADGRSVPLSTTWTTLGLAFWSDGRRNGFWLDFRRVACAFYRLAHALRGCRTSGLSQ